MIEKPPLGHSIIIRTPDNTEYRWAPDAANTEDVFSGLSYSSTAPGGFENATCQLARNPDFNYPDLTTFSDFIVVDATGERVWEGRLEDSPRSSGDILSVSPNAIGWQAHLQDDNSVTVIYITRRLDLFTEMSSARRAVIEATGAINGSFNISSPSDDPAEAAQPALIGHFDLASSSFLNFAETWFYGGGSDLGTILYFIDSNIATESAHITRVVFSDLDDFTGTTHAGTDHDGGGTAGTQVDAPSDGFKYIAIQMMLDPASDLGPSEQRWGSIAIMGRGVPALEGSWPDAGHFDATVVAHALDNFAPELTYTADSLVADESFMIPELAFLEPTNAAEIINQATRFSLRDWFVWNDRTVYLHDRGARGTEWISRAELDYVGPSAEKAWNEIVVQFQDVDGSTKTIGPTTDALGNATDTFRYTSDLLVDPDPTNPATKAGVRRSPDQPLSVGPSTFAIAEEVGRRFLEESQQLSTAGQANLGSYVEDSAGHVRPYSHVRAGDTVRFVNAQDTSARRVVKASQSESDHSVSVDLDAPPEGVAALLERFGASLGKIGLG